MTAVARYQEAVGEQEEMPTPYGYEEYVEVSDQRAGYIRDTVMDITSMAGEDGLRHMEVRTIGNTHYRIISVEPSKPTTMDDMLKLLFNQGGSKKSFIEDVYINPSIPTNKLHPKWEHSIRDPPNVAALVVKLPTSAFLQRTSVKQVDPSEAVDLNGQALAIAEIFPNIIDANTGKLKLNSQIHANDRVHFPTIYSAGPGSPAEIEYFIRSGSMSPRQQPLPQINVPLLADTMVNLFNSKTSEPWRSPVPRNDGITEYIGMQLDVMFKYMYALHVKPGTGHSIRDVPKELRLLRAEKFNPDAPVYICQAAGYTDRITVVDMLRLYLCNSSRIRDVKFDWSFQPKDRSLTRGALVVEIQVATVPPKGKPGDPDHQSPVRLSLSRVRAPEPMEVSAPASSASIPVPPPPPPPNQFRVSSTKRKAEEIVVEPPKKTPSPRSSEEVEPPAPHPVHAMGAEEQHAEQQQLNGHDQKKQRSEKQSPEPAAAVAAQQAAPVANGNNTPRGGLFSWLFSPRKRTQAAPTSNN